jgi:serine/threonine-protein kinase
VAVAPEPVRPAAVPLPPREPAVDLPAPLQEPSQAAREPTQAAVPARPSRERSIAAARSATKRAPEQPVIVPSAPVAEPAPAPAAAPTEPVAEAKPGAVESWKLTVTPPAPSPSRPDAGTTALVQLAISPWGEVFVNGKSAGVSPPMAEIELKPGKYRIEVRNGEFKRYQEEVELDSHQTIRIKHKFTQQR